MELPRSVTIGQVGATLTFHSPDPALNSCMLSLEVPGLSVSRQVDLGYEGTAQSLVDFFTGLAADWKGWDGDRQWGSTNDDCLLVCWHDRTGHVAVQVELGGEPVRQWHEAQWKVAAQVIVDPGALLVIATALSHLFGTGDAARRSPPLPSVPT